MRELRGRQIFRERPTAVYERWWLVWGQAHPSGHSATAEVWAQSEKRYRSPALRLPWLRRKAPGCFLNGLDSRLGCVRPARTKVPRACKPYSFITDPLGLARSDQTKVM